MIYISREEYYAEDQSFFDETVSFLHCLALPFSDYVRNIRLTCWFGIRLNETTIFISSDGQTYKEADALELICTHRGDIYPFTPERFNFCKEQFEETERNQSLASLLLSDTRDYLLSNDGNQVLVSELVGKTVGLYFNCANEYPSKLANIYKKLMERGEAFEVVLIPRQYRHKDFIPDLQMSWLGLPYLDKKCGKLIGFFGLRDNCGPTLVIIGPDGKTLHDDGMQLFIDYDIDAYPFSPEWINELTKAKEESLSLESFLGFEADDFVFGKDSTVYVPELVRKNILLYFADCKPCPYPHKLIDAYHDIKARDNTFEVIFVSRNYKWTKWEKCFRSMPESWLAVPPYNVDKYRKRANRLWRWFKNDPCASTTIFISSTGRVVMDGILELITAHGADAYPFTDNK